MGSLGTSLAELKDRGLKAQWSCHRSLRSSTGSRSSSGSGGSVVLGFRAVSALTSSTVEHIADVRCHVFCLHPHAAPKSDHFSRAAVPVVSPSLETAEWSSQCCIQSRRRHAIATLQACKIPDGPSQVDECNLRSPAPQGRTPARPPASLMASCSLRSCLVISLGNYSSMHLKPRAYGLTALRDLAL